jgi:hypothetical protein
MTTHKQRIGKMRADKASTACDQDTFAHRFVLPAQGFDPATGGYILQNESEQILCQ